MVQPKLEGKTKKDLVTIATISGLLRVGQASRMTKQELLDFLQGAENEMTGSDVVFPQTAVEEMPVERVRTQTAAADPADKSAKAQKTAADTAEPQKPRKRRVKKDEIKPVAEKQELSEPVEAEPAKKTRKPRTSKKKEQAVTAAEASVATAPGAEKDVVSAEDTFDSAESKAEESKTEKISKMTAEPGAAKVPRIIKKKKMSQVQSGETRKIRAIHPDHSAAEEDNLPVDDSENSAPGESVAEGSAEQLAPRPQEIVAGILEVMPENYGFLRLENYIQSNNDVYVPPQFIRRFNLRTGDLISGPCRPQRDNDRYRALSFIDSINGETPDKSTKRPYFDRLTPIYPNERLQLESTRTELSTRIIDLVSPIGKGQRGMIVSPPKAGKTILLQKIANAITINNPEVELIVLLIDERPEEVTDMQRSIEGDVVYSTFDKTPENHVKITELVLARAMRLVEMKKDVVILLDSITRMGRAYNLTINPTGRTLSGGLDPGALYGPKRFFGAARNIENGGSLTIIATALVETGSRMDEVIFEEFKGTGNMEVLLDRKLSEKRIFPAIDITRSGTRREELLLNPRELDAVWSIRKAFGQLDTSAVTETFINLMMKTRDNDQFISSINVSFSDKSMFEAMRGGTQKRDGSTQGDNRNGNRG